MTGHPDFGVPFGQDRIVPIFLATMAVRQQSPVLRFKSAAQMLETFGMQKGGKEYRRLIAAFERIFGATIFFGTHEGRPAARIISKGRFNFLRQAKLWYSRDIETAAIGEDFENEIVLSDEFYSEIDAHRIPTDLEAVKHLIDSPAVLDLFMWLSYRSFTAKGEERIPLFGPNGLTAQIGSVEYARPRKFRERLSNGWIRFDGFGRTAGRASLRTEPLCLFSRALPSRTEGRMLPEQGPEIAVCDSHAWNVRRYRAWHDVRRSLQIAFRKWRTNPRQKRTSPSRLAQIVVEVGLGIEETGALIRCYWNGWNVR